jgi:hypothetical protein
MNYLKEILAFEKWIETNPINSTAQNLYYKLLYLNNNCHWVGWFTCSNETLQAKLSVSDKTLDAARKVLVEAGRILYVSGKSRRMPGRYKINFCLTSQYTTGEFPIESDTTEDITPHINEDITGNSPNLYKQNETDKVDKEEGEFQDRQEDDFFIKILNHYMKVSQKGVESPDDITLSKKLAICPGITFEDIKTGIDESKKSWGKRMSIMPLKYCIPAIERQYKNSQARAAPASVVPLPTRNSNVKQFNSNISQHLNYDQRKYDKSYFDSLYEEI